MNLGIKKRDSNFEEVTLPNGRRVFKAKKEVLDRLNFDYSKGVLVELDKVG